MLLGMIGRAVKVVVLFLLSITAIAICNATITHPPSNGTASSTDRGKVATSPALPADVALPRPGPKLSDIIGHQRGQVRKLLGSVISSESAGSEDQFDKFEARGTVSITVDYSAGRAVGFSVKTPGHRPDVAATREWLGLSSGGDARIGTKLLTVEFLDPDTINIEDAAWADGVVKQEEKLALTRARSDYADRLERLMINDGRAAIVRAQGADNKTLYIKAAWCSDIALNVIIKSDGFANAQSGLNFKRVVCDDTIGGGATWTAK